MVRPSRSGRLRPLGTPFESGTVDGDEIDWDSSGLTGEDLTVEESDGSPSVSPVDTVIFNATDFTVTDNTDGSVTVTADEPDAAAHVADASDAHDASAVSIVDAGGYFTGTEVEAALQELGAGGGGGGVTVQDEGTPLTTTATTLDFVGAGVTATGAGATKTITIPGGGGGLTLQYPALKPGTPTYDFAGSALDGAFSAHSSGGTFATTSCMTQGANPWPGSTLEMQFSSQMGRLTLAHADTDLDFTWGGVSYEIGESANQVAVGIAAMNSSGNGILVASETQNIHFGKITAYQFSSVLSSWGAGIGPSTLSNLRTGNIWFRLKRVSGVWTGYASVSGRAWDKTFATDSTAYTVDRIGIGLFYNTGVLYLGRVLSDYVQVDV